MNEILILELNMPGQSHSMVNSAFTKALSKESANATIVCMDNHFESLGIESSNINHISFDTKGFKTEIQATKNKLSAFFKVFKNLIKLIRTTKATSGRVILLSVNEYELISLYFLQKLFPKTKFTAVIHSNMNMIKQRLGRNPYHKFFSYYQSIKRLKKTNIEIVLLEQWISDNLQINYPELKSNIVVRPHPIDRTIESARSFNEDEIAIGIAGILSPSKNINQVMSLEKAIQNNEHLKNRIKLDYCMFMPSEFASKLPKDLIIPLQETWLTNQQIEHFYSELDFIIWFHGGERTYLYSASGILLDAVKFLKSLIALTCPALSYFEKKYGRIAISGTNVNEIIDKLTNLSSNDYHQMSNNLAKIQSDRLKPVI